MVFSLSGLLVALILIAIVCVVAQVLIQLLPKPLAPPLPTIIWGIATIICLVILLQVFTGHPFHDVVLK